MLSLEAIASVGGTSNYLTIHTSIMILEWIRRRDPVFGKELKDYLFTDKPIAH